MGGVRVRALQLAVVVVLADGFERVGVQLPRATALVECEQIPVVVLDAGVGHVRRHAERVRGRTAGPLLPVVAHERLVGRTFGQVVRRAHEAVPVVDPAAVEDELREQPVTVEQMRVGRAADLVLAGTVPVQGAYEAFGQPPLHLVDHIVVLVRKRLEDAMPVGCRLGDGGWAERLRFHLASLGNICGCAAT